MNAQRPEPPTAARHRDGKPIVALAVAAAFAAACPAGAQTVLTGDLIQGVPVIERLDVADLEPGAHRFYFRATEDGIGSYLHVPVMVAKGAEAGPKLFLQAALHGDELQGVRVIQETMAGMDPVALKGTVVAVAGANPTGMRSHTRDFHATTDGGQTTNLNRVMPGSADGSDTGARFADALWSRLYAGNAEVFLDLHTQSRGTAYPFFIYADRRNEMVDRLVQLIPADQVKDDEGEAGTVETEMVKTGVAAMTVEMGAPKAFDRDMTRRGVQGVRNVMIDLGMIEGEIDMLGVETYFGNDMTSIRADRGGFAETAVGLNEDVTEGQVVARQTNAFGDVIAEYRAPFAGRVLSIGTDPIREPGALLVRLLRQKPE